MATARPWPEVPELHGTGDLARWLGLDDGRLDWLADARGLERTVPDGPLRRYRYRLLAREGGRARVIEAPRAPLRAAQRQVLDGILRHIPTHDAAHGFVRGRSVRTHALAHVGARVVLRLDLADHFASVAAGRVFGILRTAGYAPGVAHALTALCTNVVPGAEWATVPRPTATWAIDPHHRLGRLLATPHLPQGAPTSPALANLVCFSLDRRLHALAEATGASYTRYADDLVLSGGSWLLRQAGGVREQARRIARDEGFAVAERKEQLMTDGGRQLLTGIVVNQRLNTPRDEYDALRATLRNCAVHGPASQNRANVEHFRAHLEGRVAWIASVHPGRGAKLHERLNEIDWSA